MLTKHRILRFIECPRLPRYDALREPGGGADGGDAAGRLHRAQGRMLGERARTEFPGGLLIDTPDFRVACSETKRAIESGAEVLFEAAFASDSLAARPDILVRERRGAWRLWEVKAGTEVREDYLLDVAVQVHVLERSGIRVRPGLLLVDKTATTESGTIFRRVECGDEARERVSTVRELSREVMRILSAPEPPAVSLERRCRDCEFLDACWPGLPTPNVLDLYQGRGGWKHVDDLLRRGILGLADVPPDAKLTDLQKRQLDAAGSGRPIVDARAYARLLRPLRHPLRFLDFEAARFPLPEFPGQHPYDLIPFQWSCHIEERPGAPLVHREFLWDRPGDPRRSLAEALVRELGGPGSVVVYSGFEKEVLEALAALFPDLARDLRRIEARLFDLLPALRGSYYHPALGRSFSIKSVLPVLAPGPGYDRLAIGDGLEAVWAYFRLIHEELAEEERRALASDLLAYCEQDSKALHAVHAALAREAGGGAP